MPREYKMCPRVFVSAGLGAGVPVERGKVEANHRVSVLCLKEGYAAILYSGRDGA